MSFLHKIVNKITNVSYYVFFPLEMLYITQYLMQMK